VSPRSGRSGGSSGTLCSQQTARLAGYKSHSSVCRSDVRHDPELVRQIHELAEKAAARRLAGLPRWGEPRAREVPKPDEPRPYHEVAIEWTLTHPREPLSVAQVAAIERAALRKLLDGVRCDRVIRRTAEILEIA
jgi:hypothetical protein